MKVYFKRNFGEWVAGESAEANKKNFADDHYIVESKKAGCAPWLVSEVIASEYPPIQQTIDAHYSFNYTLSEEEKKSGVVKIDPYFVSNQWELGKKDNTGVLFHCLKTLARFGDKNPVEREVVALYKQVKRLAELKGINLD